MKMIQESRKLKEYYRQNLPHIQGVGKTFFVTFRLAGSIPRVKVQEVKMHYQEELASIENLCVGKLLNYLKFQLHRNYFNEIDELLHDIGRGPTFLADPRCAEICKKQIHRFDGKLYKLLAYTIMNNHVHLLIDTSAQLSILNDDLERIENEFQTLEKVLKRIKGATARYCNQTLGRKGQFWERESYDTYIRDEKMLGNVVAYILDNPVKAGLVKDWEEYEWSYLAEMSEDL